MKSKDLAFEKALHGNINLQENNFNEGGENGTEAY